MANTLPGCPIVGFYNEKKEDFEGHNQTIKIGDGNVEVTDTTIPYGFVDMNPQVWFQKFADGPNKEIHEYLMTEGYIWSGVYPESKRILTQGNNQSMELEDKFVDGNWADSDDGYYSFFIINDAVISKLCVLGEDVEPCFEGAQIKAQFSLDEFNKKFKAMAYELKEILGEGGQEMEENTQNAVLIQEEEEAVVEEKFSEEPVEAIVEEEEENFSKNDGQNEKKESEEKSDDNEEEEFRKKKKCSLNEEEEVDYAKEYVELFKEYTALQNSFNEIKGSLEKLNEEIESLREFKLTSERQEKQNLIDSFYMLEEEDKEDVKSNIDSYSLDDIEAKLSVICVRKKVNFAQDDKEKDEIVYNTNYSLNNDPAWVKSIQKHS